MHTGVLVNPPVCWLTQSSLERRWFDRPGDSRRASAAFGLARSAVTGPAAAVHQPPALIRGHSRTVQRRVRSARVLLTLGRPRVTQRRAAIPGRHGKIGVSGTGVVRGAPTQTLGLKEWNGSERDEEATAVGGC